MASDAPAAATEDLSWGRVILAGAQDWANVGKKDKAGRNTIDQDNFPDLYEPHVMRPLCNVPIAAVFSSGCSSHFIAIDTAGGAWIWGRNSYSQLGLDGEQFPVFHTGNPRRITPSSLGAPRGTKFVHAATGRSHTLLVGSNGQIWASGSNSHSQCGQPTSSTIEVKEFTLLDNLPNKDDPVVQVSAGISFSMALTAGGKVYAWGSAEHGQLGNGATGEDIGPQRKITFDIIVRPEEPVLGLEDKVITQIASGNIHSLALDSEGFVYAWGNGGYCRTGFGHQRDTVTAKPVQGYFMAEASTVRAWKIFAGPSCSIVIDQQRILTMAGKFKMSGDGSPGQPYTYFKPIEDLQPFKSETAASGGWTNFAVAPDDEPMDESVPKGTIMTAGWGQQCSNGELGMGNEAPLSSTRPNRIEPLTGVRVFAIAAGQHSTVFLARPGDATSSLPRSPFLAHPAECVVCNQDRGESDSPLECEKCETRYHLNCVNPALQAIPEDEWFCQRCSAETHFEIEEPEEGAANGHAVPTAVPAAAPENSAENGSANGGAKRKAEDEVQDADAEAKKQRVE